FIHEDFLLQSKSARRLYHEVAEHQPIIDYHCHLSPDDLARDRRFANLAEIWLEGDHYKWRAMRSNGVSEEFCTGTADPYEKFLAWCETVPHTLRNPLYHWSHLELKRYFDIDCLISPDTAREIWDEANRQLAKPDFSATGILKKFRVEVVCTTDDPTDTLGSHQAIARQSDYPTRVLPTFRPDKAMKISDAQAFNAWCDLLAERSGMNTSTFSGMLDALRKRHDDFHALGARLSDHGLEYCPGEFASDEEAANIFQKARAGEPITHEEVQRFSGNLMLFTGRLDAEKGWTKQLHLGAMRNNNTRSVRTLGPDTGFDSIGDWPQAQSLSRFLDRLESEGKLPRTILYNLNPADNYTFATMIGNFQDGSTAGKLQFGSGWWFLDQKEAIEMQINALSNCGLLSRFVGMLTDSRSLLSYPRHEYFRRILCNMLGHDMETGLLPNDFDLVGRLVADVCYHNARRYFGFYENSPSVG
ncbi:MAG: Uronate isomerase, partial [Verrucomicrobiota bacterium]